MNVRLVKWGVAIIAVGALVLGLMIGKFPGFGTGGGGIGEGTRVGLTETSPVSVERPVSPGETDARPLEVGEVIHIVVEETDGYSVKETVGGKSRYRKLPLDEIVALAKKTPARDGRVRVHVTMRPQAEGGDQRLLGEKLIEAGLERREIDGIEEVRLEPESVDAPGGPRLE